LENRKLQLIEINEMDKTERQGYIKTLKKWFKTEKVFIKEITPYIKNNENTTNGNNGRPNRTDIAYYCYYTSETKTLDITNSFPSDLAWTEIGNNFSKNSKNIQKLYNTIFSNKDERLKKSRIKTIEFVIKNMIIDNSKALNLAKDELKLAKLKS